MKIQPDVTNVALWPRYTPVQDEGDDWQTYREFPGANGDSLGKRIRFLSLAQLVRHAREVPGNFAECGCYAGASTYMIARTMEKIGRTGKLAVFDSDRKSTRLNSSHIQKSRMPSSA